MRRLMILGAGEMQVPVIMKAKSLQCFTIVADMNPDAPGMKLADISLAISTLDFTSLLEAAKKHKIDGILTTSDFPVRVVAQIGSALGLPVVSLEAAIISTDKFKQREIMKKEGLLFPRYRLLNENESFTDMDIPFPVIVKPIDSSASRGVQKVDSINELYPAIEFARNESKSGKVIIEEYVDGREFSVEVLIQDSIEIVAITAKTTAGDKGAFFVEERHVIPADISSDEDSLIRSTVKRFISAAGLRNCASHTEIKLSSRGPVIIEMAARLGGDYITSDLVPLATGVDMLENIIKMSLGEKIQCKATKKRYAGVQFILPQQYYSVLQKIDFLKKNPLIERYEVKNKEGDLPMLHSSLDRMGYFIASADERSSLLNVLAMGEL